MGSWDYHRGTLRDCHRDPFPHSLRRTRELEALRFRASVCSAWRFMLGDVFDVDRGVLESSSS